MDRRKVATLAIATLMAFGLGAMAEEKKTESKKQTTCPVMGGEVDKTQYVDVKGKRIYVCCPPCAKKIKADPDTYLKKMKAEGIVLDKAPVKEQHQHDGHDHSQHQH